MKSTRMSTILIVALGLFLCVPKVSEAEPMGTAWTYQGRLLDANSVADGLYDFQFKLFDDPCIGSLIAGPVSEPNLDVIDGYFTVELDFGSDVFDGNAVWLETTVAHGDGSDPCKLSPRQELLPVPYALHTRGIFVDSAGNVGIGTTAPSSPLHIERSYATIRLQDDDDPLSYTLLRDASQSYSNIRKFANTGNSIIDLDAVPQDGNSHSSIRFFRSTNTTGLKRVFFHRGDGSYTADAQIGVDGADSFFTGKVGIGTTNPAEKLEVAGTVNATAFVGDGSGLTGITITETDPTVLASVKDGIDWSEVSNRPAGLDDGDDVGITSETDPTVLPSVKDGVDWSEVSNRPAGLDDGDDVGITSETDPQVGSNTTNYIAKWNGSALVSGTIYDNGNVGIGDTDPSEKLEVNGNININSVYKIGGDTVLANPGTDNIFVGVGAGEDNTSGSDNTFLGVTAGYKNTIGSRNTFLGVDAGRSNTIGSSNTFVGYEAGSRNGTAWGNTFVGHGAGEYNLYGSWNTFVGRQAGYKNSTGEDNTFLGHSAGFSNDTGNSNTFLGYDAGYDNTTGTGNVFIGNKAGYNETGSNNLYIANGPADSNVLIYGDFSTGRIGIGTTDPNAKLEVNGQVQIIDGSQAAGKVLTSDANGLASWQSLSAIGDNDWMVSGNDMYSIPTGNVGIGTPSPGYKLTVSTSLPTGRAVYGKATYGSEEPQPYVNYGGYFEAAAYWGRGVFGHATGRNGTAVYGLAKGEFGTGVYGWASDGFTTEVTYGGYFVSSAESGRGVYGRAGSLGDARKYGVYGEAYGLKGVGVHGEATGSEGIGVYAQARNASGGTGVEAWGRTFDFYAAGPGTDYGSSSSIRWKRNIQAIDNALDKVARLRGVYFDWDADHGGGHDVGMVAEEVGDVLPEIVSYEENGIDATGMDYSKLTPLLVEGVKALKEEVDALRKKQVEKDNVIRVLEQQNDILEGRLAALESSIATIALRVGGGGR